MKIVDRKTFLAMPAGTLFSKYVPCIFGPLSIKDDSNEHGDFMYQQIADSIDCSSSVEFSDLLLESQENGTSVPMDFNTLSRDGCLDQGQLFAVWEKVDVEKLIRRLAACVSG